LSKPEEETVEVPVMKTEEERKLLRLSLSPLV